MIIARRTARILFIVSLLLLTTLLGLTRWNKRVRAERLGLSEIAARYPFGSPERSMALRAEILRRRHPNWSDLSVSEIADRVSVLAGHLFHPRGIGPSVTQPIAPFFGNYTTISDSYPEEFALIREADCSLSYNVGTYNYSLTNPGYTFTGKTAHYERILHNQAQLTTTADLYPNGCAATFGSSTRAVFLGKTSLGLYPIAIAGYDRAKNQNALYYGTIDSTYNFHSLSIDDANSSIYRVTGGDLNKDGAGDIVELNLSNSITVLLGNPDGTFHSPVTYPIAGTSAFAAIVDDFNGDGKPDVAVVSNDRKVSILLGNGDGTLQTAQSFTPTLPTGTLSYSLNIITADTRGIGRRDIITSDGLVLLSNGNGTFTAASQFAFPPPGSTSNFGPNLVAADLNKDGKVDVVICDGAAISIYLGKGDGSFTPGQSYATIDNVGYLTVTDLDGDGNMDIYSGLGLGPILGGDQFDYDLSYALLGNGDGTFQGAPFAKQQYTGTNLGDVNKDGHQDLVGFSSAFTGGVLTDTFTTYLGQKDGSFSPTGPNLSIPGVTVAGTLYTFSQLNSYALADVNGDGRADLLFIPNVLTSYYQRSILAVALGQSDGSFAAPIAVELPSLLTNPATLPGGTVDFDYNMIANSLQITDLNGDGKPDILFSFQENVYSQNGYIAGFVFQPGNGDGTFGAPKTLQTYNGSAFSYALPTFATFADVNGDGKLDLITVQRIGSASAGFTTQTLLNINKGDGSFNASSPLTLGDPVTVPVVSSPILAVDLNKDGKIDLITLGTDPSSNLGSLSISLGRGDGTFLPATKITVPDSGTVQTDSLAVADFNGDGKLDIAVTSFVSSATGIYLGNGDGTLAPFLDSTGGVHPSESISLSVFGPAIAADFDGDGKVDLLAGNVLLRTTAATLATTTTTVTSNPASPVVAGTSITFTATITPASGSTGAPTGLVTFLDGAATLGTGTISGTTATYTTSALSAGTHSITAVYAGDTNFTGSSSAAYGLTITTPAPIATTTTLTSSATSATPGTLLTFTAQVTPASGTITPTGNVIFTDGTTTLGAIALSSGKAVLTTSALALGTHSITASYTATASFSASVSSSVSVTIAAAPVPDFSISVAPSTSTVTGGGMTTATLSVTPVNGFNQPVALTCGGAPSGATCTVSPSSVTPASASPANATVTLQTTATHAALTTRTRNGTFAALPFGIFFTGLLGGIGFRRRRRSLGLLCTLMAVGSILIGASGCGGNSNSSATPVTSTITLTGTSGSLSHSTTWMVTVH